MNRHVTMTLAAASLLAARLAAQTPTPAALNDSRLCSRLVDDHDATVRDAVTRNAAAGGARGLFFEGCLHLADGKAGDATDAFDKALHSDPSNAVWQYWLGSAFGDRAEHANVLRQAMLARNTRNAFERAVQLAPDYLDPREALVEYDLQAPGMLGGGVDKARAQAAEITKRDRYRGAMSEIEIARHENDTASTLRLDESLIKQYPDSFAPHQQRINILISTQKWPEAWAAVDGFERALPNDMRATYAVGRLAGASGEQLPRGEKALRAYLEHTPKRGEPSLGAAHWRLGQILEHEQNAAGAKQEYQTAVALDSTLAGAKRALERLK